MVKFLSFCLTFLTSCGNVSVIPRKWSTKEQPYLSIGHLSVMSIDGKSGMQATGFAIDDTHIMSVAHFCVAAFEGNVKGYFPQKINLEIIHNKTLIQLHEVLEIEMIEEKNDVCILHGEHGLSPVKFAKFSNVEIGDKVVMWGFPFGLLRKTEGYVSVPKFSIGDSRKFLFIGMNVSPGNSGSPIFNEQGEVVGMLFASLVPHIFLIVNSPFSLAQRSDVLKKYADAATAGED